MIVIAIISFIYSLALGNLYSTQSEYDTLKKKLVDLNTARTAYLVTKVKHDGFVANINQRQNDFELIVEEAPEMSSYLRALSHLVPSSFYLDTIRTSYIPELIVEKKVEEKRKKKSKKEVEEEPEEEIILSYDEIVSDLEGKDEEEKDKKMRRQITGKVMDINGMVYSLGRLTEVQFANFVYSLESSGWFRDVAVQEVEKLDNGRVKFKITLGL